MVSLLIGALLLVTAALKAHGLWADPYSQESILLSPRLLVAVIEVEVVLGLWLLSGHAQRAAWLAALGFFALATMGSLYLALEGQRSCGCFGRVAMSPWWTLGIDLGVLATLALFSPFARQCAVHEGTATFQRILPLLFMIVASFTVAMGILVALLFGFSESPDALLAQLRGEQLSVDPPIIDVGEGHAGQTHECQIRLVNHYDRAIRIVGGMTTCACITTEDLPMSLPPGESGFLKVRFKFRGSPGQFQRQYTLYTDLRDQSTVSARFAGRVNAGTPP